MREARSVSGAVETNEPKRRANHRSSSLGAPASRRHPGDRPARRRPLLLFVLVLLLSATLPTAAQDADPAAETVDQRIQTLLREGRYDDAETLLRRLGDDGSVRALLALARLEAGRGDARAAARTLRRALALAPNAEEVLSAFARVHLGAGRPGPALRALEALVRMHPDVPEHAYLLGVARLQVGDLDAAVEPLERAAELAPDQARHHVALGLALNRRKRFDPARDVLRRALALDPESPEALAALAEAEEGLSRHDDARRHARAALALEPESTEAPDGGSASATAHFVLGLLAMDAGDHAAARDAFLRALASESADPRLHYQLSLAYARLGERDASRLHRDAYQRHLREAEERLASLRRAPPLYAADDPSTPAPTSDSKDGQDNE